MSKNDIPDGKNGVEFNKKELLEFWAEKKGLLISDLRFPSYQLQMMDIMEQTPTDSYSVQDWNEALGYMFDQKLAFSSVEEAKGYAKNCLQTL